MNVLEKPEAQKVFNLFTTNLSLKFNEIEKTCGIHSNELSYYLKKLVEHGLIEKKDNCYILTRKGETTAERIAHLTGKEVGHMVVVIIALTKDDKILLVKRNKRPFKGYWGMIGGKTIFDESILDAVEREVEEETGLKIDAKSLKTKSVLLERIRTNQGISHGNILILNEVKPLSVKSELIDDRNVKWFKTRDLEKNSTILSDFWMIKKFINQSKGIKIPHIIIDEKNGKITNIKFLK